MKNKSKSLEIVQKFYPSVSNVIDASKPLSIEVTEKDSNSSRLKDHNECALAMACKRKFKADAVIISIKTAYIIIGHRATRYHVPEAVAREIVSFDHHGGFSPGTYQLRPPPASSMIGSPHRGGTYTGAGKKRTYHRTENVRTDLRQL